MSAPVVIALVFWIPAVVAGVLCASLAAEHRGRAAIEGAILGLLIGPLALALELMLPGHEAARSASTGTRSGGALSAGRSAG